MKNKNILYASPAVHAQVHEHLAGLFKAELS